MNMREQQEGARREPRQDRDTGPEGGLLLPLP